MSTCITCQHFTLKPRAGAQSHLTASDVAHARVGMGRCLKETLALRWIGAESSACDKHAPVSDKQAAQRREWIKGRKV
ncbi:hypothetical protein LMG31506_00212 [Cupriavidus yeoncheonensis]|uniref:Uncharacterized protein n=1 Tax=Cupriavidus yeoncheonensis TaxID=1462994 RepID=A0A916IQI0_9BURK|nr:hypothetical protein [Cupriavidus yeoncheonensis]CAG2126867.1 hypothetical protein LMG31506_00212 [Cupriavidus yeoncheonensis]